MNSTNAKEVARMGANIELTADCGINSTNAKEIVRIVAANKKKIVVSAKAYNSTNIKEMVRIGGDYITIKI
ncbi:hypothetical protein XM79_c11551 [Vibrio vulnificus]|uniref:hypothetical protein n=1 Tax=Vibrio vulnificus TaxID=672 RepID=UPI0009B63C9C|nr:hypothetical protein [Vibrio vulnificus]OQK64282.1 hypothetical protein XM78_c11569 [Vibrio vulnificus]OQK66684.1 hypothetical protein XM79_c11551 [Vibrio vulnificus]